MNCFTRSQASVQFLFNSHGDNIMNNSFDEKVACKKILEKKGLKGFQVNAIVSCH